MITGLVIASALCWVALLALAARVERHNAIVTANARATLAMIEADRLREAMKPVLSERRVPADYVRREYRDR